MTETFAIIKCAAYTAGSVKTGQTVLAHFSV